MLKHVSIPILSLVITLFSFFIIPQTTFASTKITISGNGAGSHNSVTVTNNNTFNTIQTNISSFFNSIFTNVNTGNNNSNGNTNGNTFIKTGNAKSDVTESFSGNTNIISVPEFSIFQGFIVGGISLIGFLFIKKRFI